MVDCTISQDMNKMVMLDKTGKAVRKLCQDLISYGQKGFKTAETDNTQEA